MDHENRARWAIDALESIVNAANAFSHPIHFAVREAIDRGRVVLQDLQEEDTANVEDSDR